MMRPHGRSKLSVNKSLSLGEATGLLMDPILFDTRDPNDISTVYIVNKSADLQMQSSRRSTSYL